MSAIEAEPASANALVVRLDRMLADLAAAVIDTTVAADADRIERIARLEKLRAATAALQAAESVRLAQSQVAGQLAAEVHPTTRLRDQTCRDPYCDAPIRHIDHITRHSDRGATTCENCRGTCARGNLVREIPGWHITLIDCGFHTGPHKIIITTPTGHHYISRAPDQP